VFLVRLKLNPESDTCHLYLRKPPFLNLLSAIFSSLPLLNQRSYLNMPSDTENADDSAKDIPADSVRGGVYPSSLMQRTAISQETRAAESKLTDVELASVSSEMNVDARDFRKKQVITSTSNLNLQASCLHKFSRSSEAGH
jgi:hypothetical protein